MSMAAQHQQPPDSPPGLQQRSRARAPPFAESNARFDPGEDRSLEAAWGEQARALVCQCAFVLWRAWPSFSSSADARPGASTRPITPQYQDDRPSTPQFAYMDTNSPARDHRQRPPVAVGETFILLRPPLPLVGVSTPMERGCQQNDSLADG